MYILKGQYVSSASKTESNKIVVDLIRSTTWHYSVRWWLTEDEQTCRHPPLIHVFIFIPVCCRWCDGTSCEAEEKKPDSRRDIKPALWLPSLSTYSFQSQNTVFQENLNISPRSLSHVPPLSLRLSVTTFIYFRNLFFWRITAEWLRL